MLSFSFLHCCNVQREQAGIVLMIMREEIRGFGMKTDYTNVQ